MSYQGPDDPRYQQQSGQPTEQWQQPPQQPAYPPQSAPPVYGAPYGQQPYSAPPAPPYSALPVGAPPTPKKNRTGVVVLAVVIGAVVLMCGVIVAVANSAGNKTNNAANTTNDTATIQRSAPAAASPEAASPTPPPAPPKPKTIYTLKGKGIKKTAKFTTPDEWTLRYTYDCSKFLGGTGNFVVTENDGGGGLQDLLVNELDKKGNDSVPQHNDSGEHYLEVNSECSWTITVVG
jgi:hypothetical protein